MELDHYIEQAIEAAENGSQEGVIHAISSMTHKDFRDFKIVFDLTKHDAISAELIWEMIQAGIEKITSTNFQNKVSFLMP